MYMSVTIGKPAEQDVVAEKVKYIVDCYIKRKSLSWQQHRHPLLKLMRDMIQSTSRFCHLNFGI